MLEIFDLILKFFFDKYKCMYRYMKDYIYMIDYYIYVYN